MKMTTHWLQCTWMGETSGTLRRMTDIVVMETWLLVFFLNGNRKGVIWERESVMTQVKWRQIGERNPKYFSALTGSLEECSVIYTEQDICRRKEHIFLPLPTNRVFHCSWAWWQRPMILAIWETVKGGLQGQGEAGLQRKSRLSLSQNLKKERPWLCI